MGTVGDTPTSQCKVNKVLTVRLHHRHPRFFRLPRELRDHIYALVVEEPPLYDRRHRPGCHYHDRREASETPVIYDADKTVPQSDPCSRRRGLGLLRVNRQIYREASQIFWATNTICFVSYWRALDRLTEMPVSIRGAIRRLAIWNVNPSSGTASHRAWRGLVDSLLELTALEHLEVHEEAVCAMGRRIWRLPSLKTLIMWSVRGESYGDAEFRLANVRLGFRREWELSQSRKSEEEEGNFGMPHQDVVRDIETTARAWQLWNDDATNAILDKLERLQPARVEDGAFEMWIRLPSGESETVYVWGLPLDTPHVRIERRKKERAKSLASLRGVPRQKVLYHDEEDIDDSAVFGQSSTLSRRTRVEYRTVHELELEERRERKAEQARQEGNAKRKEKRAAEKARKQSSQEIAAMKKAAKKRASR